MEKKDLLLTDEEIEKLVLDSFRNDALLEHRVSTRGHWEDIAPIIAQAQLSKVLKAGYKSPEEVKLMYNPDYLDFQKGVEATNELYKGYVKLADIEAKMQLEQCDPDVMPYFCGYYWIDKEDWHRL